MPAAAAFVACFIAVRLLIGPLGRFGLDQPNERSLHERPVPRTGGIAILAGVAAAAPFGPAPLWLPMLVALGLAGVSLIDDLRGMPSGVRLALHLVAAAAFCWYILAPIDPLEFALIALGVAWLINLYNFMDGSDGLAGGMSLIGFGAYSAAAWSAGHDSLAALSLALAAASAAFLAHNFHPARIFLGDVGSIPLGFLAGALGVVGWRDDVWPLWFPVLVFGPFIGDATVTLVKRVVRGERVWRAHREHYYQRMVRMGFGHRTTAVVAYGAMALCAISALLGRNQSPTLQASAFFSGAALLAAIAIWIDLRWGRA